MGVCASGVCLENEGVYTWTCLENVGVYVRFRMENMGVGMDFMKLVMSGRQAADMYTTR